MRADQDFRDCVLLDPIEAVSESIANQQGEGLLRCSVEIVEIHREILDAPPPPSPPPRPPLPPLACLDGGEADPEQNVCVYPPPFECRTGPAPTTLKFDQVDDTGYYEKRGFGPLRYHASSRPNWSEMMDFNIAGYYDYYHPHVNSYYVLPFSIIVGVRKCELPLPCVHIALWFSMASSHLTSL